MESDTQKIAALIAGNMTREAVDLIQAAIPESPQNPELHRLLGECHRLLGQHSEALLAYKKALELKPGFVPTLGQIGHTLCALHRDEDAIKVLPLTEN